MPWALAEKTLKGGEGHAARPVWLAYHAPPPDERNTNPLLLLFARARWISIGGGVGIIGIPFVSTAIPTHPIDGFDGRA